MKIGLFIGICVLMSVFNLLHAFLIDKIYYLQAVPDKETNEPLNALMHVFKYCLAPIFGM